ncbi:MAG: N-6 DNA methylase, partial [bacterium]|nr:N-6 DNA methylase [bacterium]
MAGGDKPIKPGHRAIKAYYEELARYADQEVKHETAVRSAFQNLLAEAAKKRRWTLVPELAAQRGGIGRVVPDGTVRDEFLIPRGYWEAKDTDDDLDAEIAKKIAKGYPLTNTIFEDTREGVLYQDGHEALRASLTDKKALADLLNAFLTHSEPNIDEFEKAVDEFKERVPELAFGLTEKIAEAHQHNKRFMAAFGEFFEVCKTSLNPNLSEAAVDEMLVQHLLTERLFRTIFDDADFTRRNAVAAEVEKVVDALVSKSFNRHDFLKSLDRFYVAIEDAARALEDFTEKQHFLNTVYERFFQGYSVKVADTMGIVYTPQPIVDFMCASVAEVLKAEFGKPLGSPDVQILDPCTGTGNFVVNLLRRVPKRDLPRMYREQLFANEVMLMPYYIAALNIEHAYYELTREYEPFEGLCFVDTLDMAEHAQSEFCFMTEKNTTRVERQKDAPITVILGNPPYNVGQLNENDNNKNRKYGVVDRRIHDTYADASKASNKNALSDAYVKFFRWATDRLDDRDGIVCFVSNNSFVDQLAFDGMRKHLLEDFTHVYHLDLHGNVRKNPKLSGTTHNVFGIQVGVGITVAVRKRNVTPASCRQPRQRPGGTPEKSRQDACDTAGETPAVKNPELHYHRVPEFWRKEEKLGML